MKKIQNEIELILNEHDLNEVVTFSKVRVGRFSPKINVLDVKIKMEDAVFSTEKLVWEIPLEDAVKLLKDDSENIKQSNITFYNNRISYMANSIVFDELNIDFDGLIPLTELEDPEPLLKNDQEFDFSINGIQLKGSGIGMAAVATSADIHELAKISDITFGLNWNSKKNILEIDNFELNSKYWNIDSDSKIGFSNQDGKYEKTFLRTVENHLWKR